MNATLWIDQWDHFAMEHQEEWAEQKEQECCTVSFKSICRSRVNLEKVLRIRGGAMQVYYHNQ